MSEEMNVQDFCTEEEVVFTAEPDPEQAEADFAEESFASEQQDEQQPEQPADEAVYDEQPVFQAAANAEFFVMLAEQNAVLKEQLAGLEEKLDKLTAQVVSTNRAVSMHETIEGNLNKELQQYKNDFYSKLATPFLMQLISLHNEMDKEVAELKAEIAASEEPTGHEDVVMSLEYYMEKILGSLTNSGVEIRVPELGEKIDPIEQRIVKTIPSDDPEQNGVIESVRSNAYIYHGKILLPAKVTVYKA